MENEPSPIERYNLMFRNVSFRVHHYRSMARMMQLILFLQVALMLSSFRLDHWWVYPWLCVVQLACFGFAVFMVGRSLLIYMRRARKLKALEKAMLQFRQCRNKSQFYAAQEQVAAALNQL